MVQALICAPACVSQQVQDPKVGGESSFDPGADASPGSNSNARKTLGALTPLPETLLGEVHSPGRLELLSSHTLADMIALAGGATLYAGRFIDIQREDGAKIDVQRTIGAVITEDSQLLKVMVRPRDTVTVSRAGIVYVLGGVNRPGGYVMQDGGQLDVPQALSLAFGTELNAAVDSMWLVRKSIDGQLQGIPAAYRKVMKGKLPSPQLQAGDVLYVPISKVRTALSASLLNSAATAAVYYTSSGSTQATMNHMTTEVDTL